MTFLELCVRAAREAEISGGGPTTVTGQTGKLLKLVGWVAEAWVDIQRERPNWLFMWSEFSFTATAGARDILAADKSVTDLSRWDRNSFLINLTTDDQNWLPHLEYTLWKDKYRAGMAARPSDRPQLFTVLPNNKIRLEPVPDVDYVLEGEYYRTAQNFVADADVPTNFPDDFHMMIVWQALKYYGFHEDAPDVLDEAETNFDNMLTRLEQDQLPEMSENYATLA